MNTQAANKNEITIDAAGQRLGRLAADIAVKLRAKDVPGYKPHVEPSVVVRVSNVSALDISEKKAEGKIYTSYSGYPGGLKERTLEEVVAKHGYGEVLRRAVYGMLPGNKLRPRIMKNLVIEE